MHRGITKRESLRDFKSGQRLQNRGKEITNWGKRDCKLGQGFQNGEGITNRYRTTCTHECLFYKSHSDLWLRYT